MLSLHHTHCLCCCNLQQATNSATHFPSPSNSWSRQTSCSHACNYQHSQQHLQAITHKHTSVYATASGEVACFVVIWLYHEDPRPKECLAPQRAAHNMTVQCPSDASPPASSVLHTLTMSGYLAAELGAKQSIFTLCTALLLLRCCLLWRQHAV